MGISLSALLTGASQARAGYSQGKQQAEEQSEQDGLQRALLMYKMKQEAESHRLAQALGNQKLKSKPAEPRDTWERFEADGGIYERNPHTHEVRPINYPETPRTPTIPSQSRNPDDTPGDIDLSTALQGGPPTLQQPQQPRIMQPKTSKPVDRPKSLDEKLHERVAELVASGTPLEKANKQARAEYGQAPPPVAQQSFTPVTLGGNDGTPPQVVPFNTRSGTAGAPIGDAKPQGQGAANQKQRVQALANAGDALAAFETTLTTIGSTLTPGVNKSALETDYENLQLQLKELYNLGVLNGPDLALMRRIVNNPTDFTGRALAAGSSAEQTRRIQTQVAKMREKLEGFKKNLVAGNAAIAPAAPSGRAGGNPRQQPSGNIDLRTPQKAGGNTITVNGKTFKVPE